MNAKDLKTDSALGGRINDGSTKYAQSGSSHQNNSNKSYQDIGTNSLGKVDVQTSRPCAIIGPDRVLPSQNCGDGYIKKTTTEPWPCVDNIYRQPSDYTHKISEYQPTRNISPRQTFQENMQRIMVSPYSSMKKTDDPNFPVDRNVAMLKDVKLSVPLEAKYCEVPYTVNPACNEQKSVRISDMQVTNTNPGLPRNPPHGWPHTNINMRSLRSYGVPELYQYPDYPSCTGPRPLPIVRPQRIVHDESGRMYPETYYQDANIRFRPYPPTKGRYPHGRYEYVSNYSNTFHPSPPFPPQAYDSQKSVPTHSYPVYPQVPVKYIDRRTGEPVMDGYQRPNPQGNINVTYHNPIIHPPYGPLQTNCVQNIVPYPSENSPKAVPLNKLPYTNSSKIYADYEILQNKKVPIGAETMYANDLNRIHPMKGEAAYPNFSTVNMHGIPSQHTLYRRENISLKNFEYIPHLKNLEHPVNFRNQLLRHPIHFSPNSIAISPSDSNTSNDTAQTHSTSQEDYGYVSQSSTTSGRSLDLHVNGIPNEHQLYRSPDRYGYLPKNIQTQNSNSIKSMKVKKDINVRQFLQMWNEGDDESGEQNKDENIAKDSNNLINLPSQYENTSKQEQLYVLGLVNVPSEELGKYDHIQKISKLPENIKGYNNIELLTQFEEVIESSNIRNINTKTQRISMPKQSVKAIPRPVSPLDVEAKISQSVIHKEVGCNFEIKPCSPKMLNVEIATPVENILDERIIEKVSNPIITQPITLHKADKINIETSNYSNTSHCEKSLKEVVSVASCNMENLKYTNDNSLDIKENYSLQELEYNSSVCLASLPRLDNDIELNFPEINQQFINANKIESLTSSTALKDVPSLNSGDLERNVNNEQAGKINEMAHYSPNRETDKEITKLSKFRKLKKSDLDQKEIQNQTETHETLITTQFRTDSVIIKNPDNVKTHDTEHSPLIVQNINNKSNINYSEVKQNENAIIEKALVTDKNQSIYTSNENISDVAIAIDFSLNKSDIELQKSSQKENTANEPLLNFIEENIKISESYENSHLPTIANDKLNIDNREIVEPADGSDINTSLKLLNNGEQKSETHDVIKTIKEEDNVQSKLEFSDSTDVSDLIPNDTEVADYDSLPKAVHNTNKSSLNCSESIISGVSPHTEDVSEASSELFHACLKDKSHEETYPICENDYERDMFNDKDAKNDADKVMSIEKNQMLSKEPHHVYINSETTKHLNLHCQNVGSSLESVIESQTQEKNKNINSEYKENVVQNILTEHNKCEKRSATEKESKINKRLYSSIIFNLMISSVEKSKEIKITQNIQPSFNQNIENTNTNNCTNQSISLLESNGILLSNTEKPGTIDTVSSEKSVFRKEFEILRSEITDVENMKLHKENSCNNNNKTNCTANNLSNHDTIEIKNNSLEREKTDFEFNNTNYICCESSEKMHNCIINCNATMNEEKETLLSYEIETNMDEKQIEYIPVNEVANISEHRHNKRSVRLKRSLSDSALNINVNKEQRNINNDYNIPKKRKKINPCELTEPNVIAEKLCNIIQTNRRNSISTLYGKENVSFCILIDNSSDLVDENVYSQKISLAEIPEDAYEGELKDNCILTTENVIFTDDSSNKITCSLMEDLDTNTNVELQDSPPVNDFIPEYTMNEQTEDKTFGEAWIEDVACIETVFSDEVSEDICLDPPSTPKDNHELECESGIPNDSLIYNDIDHMNKIKCIYGGEMCNDDADLVETLYRTPQMDVRKTLLRRESQYSDECTRYYDNDSLEKILSESNYKEELVSDSESIKVKTNVACSDTLQSKIKQDDKENLEFEASQTAFNCQLGYPISDCYDKAQKSPDDTTCEPTQYDIVHSCESTCDYSVSYRRPCENPRYSISSSPEVSSTTSEEKSCGILLKITNCNGSISSQLNEFSSKSTNKLSSKSSDAKEIVNNSSNISRKRPLITKAAQKYIPPLKETIPDLKVKLPLPKHSLNKLKILKKSKDKPKLDKAHSKNHNLVKPHNPKKTKPKFEDVLKSIDELQIKMHKEKNKKQKQSIPKVVIKKNENGAHYASTSNDNNTYNPDLTGRKWQPWVFIEKNYFIDKMALNKKVKAVFNYRKNTYVLAEKFRKYKSIHNAKFVITQPKFEDISSGKLKYTIRLKQNY